MSYDRLRDILQHVGCEPTPLEIAESVWLAARIDPSPRDAPGPVIVRRFDPSIKRASAAVKRRPPPNEPPPQPQPELAGLHLPELPDITPRRTGGPVRLAAPQVLPSRLRLARALRPLKRQAPVPSRYTLDEEASARYVAETGRWYPRLRRQLDRWLDATLVVDATSLAELWIDLAREIEAVLRDLGAFRALHVRYLVSRNNGEPALAWTPAAEEARQRALSELVDPSGRTLVLVLTDGVGDGWWNGKIHDALARWSNAGPVAILQTLPSRLWSSSGVAPIVGCLAADSPGVPNSRMAFAGLRRRSLKLPSSTVAVPVLEVTEQAVGGWAAFVGGAGGGQLNTFVTITPSAREPGDKPPPNLFPLAPEDRVAAFRATASPSAYRLLSLLAAAPISLGVVRVVQRAIAPGSSNAEIAEIFYSGLLEPEAANGGIEQQYEFLPGVREVLLGNLRRHEALRVLGCVSSFIEQHIDEPGSRFTAVVDGVPGDMPFSSLLAPFARIRMLVLSRIGNASQTRKSSPERAGQKRRSIQDFAKLSDGELMAAYRAGEEEAFAALYARNAPLVLEYVKQIADDDELAHDVLQDTFAQLFQTLARDGDAPTRLRAYLHMSAHRILNSHRRRYHARIDFVGGSSVLDSLPAPQQTGPLDAVTSVESVRSLLAHLSKGDAELLMLWADGANYDEIAARLGVSRGSVSSRLQRARRRAREALDDPQL